MKLASQTPPHIRPPVETVAILGLLLVKVMSAVIVVPEVFSGMAVSVATCPWLSEMVAGESTIVATNGGLVELPPPHPPRKRRMIAVENVPRIETTGNRRMHPPRRTGDPADLIKAESILTESP
jgi:hypothetical protein